MGMRIHSMIGKRSALTDASTHVIGDIFFKDLSALEHLSRNPIELVRNIGDAIEIHGGSIITNSLHVFSEDGAFTVLFLLKESHVSIHTWPEHFFAAVDVFTCGKDADALNIIKELLYVLDGADCETIVVQRGPFLSI